MNKDGLIAKKQGRNVTETEQKQKSIAVLGAGITGLTSACLLQQKGEKPLLIESDKCVGGLAKTIDYNGFKFDLGGHRFLTNNFALESFVKALLNQQYIVVPRSSTIYLDKNYIKYPLEPLDTFAQVGFVKSMHFVYDYMIEKIKGINTAPHYQDKCLEDWVIHRFGRALYQSFFKEYSEKVWGIDCRDIDSDWIATRIQNLNLAKTIKSVLFKKNRKNYATLTDKFLYPSQGIGHLAQNLGQMIDRQSMLLGSQIQYIEHDHKTIKRLYIKHAGRSTQINIQQIISTIPVRSLLGLLHPRPPDNIIELSKGLRSRDLILVTLMLNRQRVTKDCWIYFPEKQFPFGRIHEPKNWSAGMAPEGKTSIVTEHFCFRGDETWCCSDAKLIDRSIRSLCRLNMIDKSDVIDALVVRVKNAYPLFETGYRDNCRAINDYLGKFSNLILAGRSGQFRYYNMDQAMLAAVNAVEKLTESKVDLSVDNLSQMFNPSYGEFDEMRAYHTGLVT